MGIENCNKNVWAVALKEIVQNKSKEDFLYITEEEGIKYTLKIMIFCLKPLIT